MKLVIGTKGKIWQKFWVLLVFLTPLLVKAHTIQLAWCGTCEGKFRLFIEHWHTSNFDPSSTIEIDYTINGVTTRKAGVLYTTINTSFNTLPTFATPIISFAACPSANTENWWAVYDFDSIPCSVDVEITVIGGDNDDLADGCGIFPASVGTIQLPCPPPITILPNQYGCANDSVPPTSLQNFGQAGTVYHWTNSNPNIGLASSGVGQQLPGFNTPFSSVTEVAEISVSENCNQAKFNIIVNPKPKPNFTLSLPDSTILDSVPQITICWNDSINLAVTQHFDAYNWSNGDSTLSTTPSTEALYFVEVTDSNGCTGTSDSVQIDINSMLPSIINTPNGNAYCVGDSLFIYTNSNWNNLLWTPTSDTIDSLFINSPGIYSYTAIDDSGCITNSDSINIIEHSLPTVEISPIFEDSLCLNDSVFLSSTTNLNQYLWSDGSTLSEGFFNLNIHGDTTIYLTGTDHNNCQNQDSISIKVVDCQAYDNISENTSAVKIKVTNQLILIEATDLIDQVELINLNGQVVYAKAHLFSTELLMSVNHLKTGIYFVKIQTIANKNPFLEKITIYSQ
ncbi:MAG: T9SS type A sorting domain-containing protein [Flavobacteriales bacterium]|jgi:hypothetical protein|nr:T9SS type A sorting domain-containing protein [Flavobacteriales bacterium]